MLVGVVVTTLAAFGAMGADGGVQGGGVETFPYIEATEVTPKGEFSDIRTVRTYRAGEGDTMLVSSTAFVVPWSWGEREIKAFCKPTFKVSEGEVVETKKDWWEEVGRTNYPCIFLGNKVMVNRKIFTIKAERGVITTVGTRRQPVRGGHTIIIPEEGEGERFVAVTVAKGQGAVVACGVADGGGSVETDGGEVEYRWKARPGKEISLQAYSFQ